MGDAVLLQNMGLMGRLKSTGTSSTFGQPPQARAAGDLASQDAPTARFARANHVTSTHIQVKWALEIRAVQKVTRLGVCLPVALRREASDSNLPDERRQSGAGGEGKIVRKANVEKIFRRLLDNCTNPQTFAQAMKHINQRMLAVLDQVRCSSRHARTRCICRHSSMRLHFCEPQEVRHETRSGCGCGVWSLHTS